MPHLMQDYEVEVQVTVRVRKVSMGSKVEPVMEYTAFAMKGANSYESANSIPAAVTKGMDDTHKSVAAVARLTKEYETERLK